MYPEDLLKKAVVKDREYGWKFDDIPLVIAFAKSNRMAIIGGQVQYVLPGATCELYWRSADTESKSKDESWATYVSRSCDQFLSLFNSNILSKKKEIEQDAVESFPAIRENLEEGKKLSDYECFIIYPVSEHKYKMLGTL